ncbi:MAG: aminopeptidase P family protein [Gemmatimonadales bacterium]|nr:aminopeptidase P family protein [Gemmatimonadales bacterium]
MLPFRARPASTLLIVFLAVGALPSPARSQVSRNDYAARRTAVLSGIDSGVVVAFGEVEPVSYWPTFFQLPSFYYLTGFGETDAALVLVKRKDGASATMFVPTRNAVQERWIGARTRTADMKTRTGIDGRDIAELGSAVDSLAKSGLPFYLISDVRAAENVTADSLTRGRRFLSELRTSHPWLVTRSLDTAVIRLRAKKSAAEIALLRKAAQISVKGHQEAMKATAPGCGENEIQALLEGTFRRLGGDRPGYGSIVGSGSNATILHYMEDNRVMQEGELLLIDAAGSFDHYSADITRTLPVSGRFTPEQRTIYQIVLDAQGAFVRQIKPGSSLLASNDSGKAVVAKGLLRLGLIESAGATFDPPAGMPCPPSGCSQLSLYALHGYGGHGIGLEVHDPAQYYQAAHRFEPGDVFTVEPGLYFSPDLLGSLPDTPKNRTMLAKVRPAFEKYKGMGVRIEDDYALTESGLEWLSAGAPREIAEVEALMRQPVPDLPGGGGCQRMRS